jgi:hypothetical protein
LTLIDARCRPLRNTSAGSAHAIGPVRLSGGFMAYLLSRRATVYGEFDYTSYRHAVVSTLDPAGASSQTAVTGGIDYLF